MPFVQRTRSRWTGFSGGPHRRDPCRDPRRPSCHPARLCGDRGQRGRQKQHLGVAGTDGRYELPIYAPCRVHRDHHIEIAKAHYSVPGNLLGAHVQVRAHRRLVRVFHRSQLIKVCPRQQPGQFDGPGRSACRADHLRVCGTSPTCNAILPVRFVFTLQLACLK